MFLRTAYWAAALLLCLAAFPAQAADERFAVEINVDVTNSNASLARERAMSEANRAAIVEVAKRITTSEGAARLAAMTDDQLINFIKEVLVISEKTSNVRYIANLRVVLNEGMLRQYMQERDIPLLIQSNTRVLIIPIFRESSSDAPMLWESSNLWRQAWDSARGGMVVTLIPLPTSGTNYSIIDANKAQALDGPALDKLMRVNGADEVYVLDAVYTEDGLEVQATSYSGNTTTIKVIGTPGSMELFNAAVDETEKYLDSQVRQQNLKEGAQESSAVIMYNFSSLREWVAAESMLRSIPYVKDIEMQAMGTNKAQFRLLFVGSHEKLLYALRDKSYNLVEGDKFFILEKV